MKRLKTCSLAAAIAALTPFVGDASAGTLTVVSGPSYNPSGAFKDSTIKAESLRPETVRMSGDTTVTPTPSSTPSITIFGSFVPSAGDRASGAYSFVIDSNVSFPVQYELYGAVAAPGHASYLSTKGTVLPGLNQYRGVFQAPTTFPVSASGTFSYSIRFISGAGAAQPAATSDAAAPGTPDAAPGTLAVSIQQYDLQLAPAAVTTIPTSQLLNISTRLGVQTGENVLIGGFIVTGDAPKRVLIRGLGPSLAAANVTGALQDPLLELNNGALTNDNWKSGGKQADIEATGIPPQDDREAAIVATLSPGAHTAVLRGVGNSTGIGLIEVYDLAQTASSKLANISSRGLVQTGNDVMIGGFILGPSTNTSSTVVVRAIGPSLSAGGVQSPLQNPTLDLRDAEGTLIASNDDWEQGSDSATIKQRGLAPNNPVESAVLAIPGPGNYTAVISGVNNETGVGSVEVYQLQ